MAKNLLNYADMHSLRDQQCGGSMPGVVDPGIPDLRLVRSAGGHWRVSLPLALTLPKNGAAADAVRALVSGRGAV